MEKETLDIIGCILILVMVISGIGIGFYSLRVLSSSKKEKKDNRELELVKNRSGINIYNSELRKFCIEQVGVFRPLGNCIRDANVLYEYISNGYQIKDKEVEA